MNQLIKLLVKCLNVLKAESKSKLLTTMAFCYAFTGELTDGFSVIRDIEPLESQKYSTTPPHE
ncbi:hypothetical protein CDO51_05525 [Natranaerobius trueperi]|uniref:Uncharacterized protein n=1 Tax=Natranaerobius trueperi TaxID=759412 RepID=A0A226BYA8_9FIRM|nr:hypothetical protein CDO51_05525 [Natranaerobius trueperi]